MDVAEEAAETVGVVEAWVGFEAHGRSLGQELAEDLRRLAAVAFPFAQLRRVDLDEANARPVLELE